MSIRAGSEPSVDPELAGPATPSLPPPTRRIRRRRRPSGAPPPLPRSIGSTGKGWIVATAVFVVVCLVAIMSPAVRRACEQLDSWMLRGITRTRTDALTDVLSAVNRAAMGWAMFVVAITLIVSMVVFRRWRQLFTFLGSSWCSSSWAGLYHPFQRPRPFDVTIIGRWEGFAIPSATVGILAFTVVGAIYSVVVPAGPGSWPSGWASVIVVVCAVPAVPGSRPSHRCARRPHHWRGGPAQRLPGLHPERGVPGHLPRRQDRPSRRRRPPRRRPAPGRPGPAGPHGARHQAHRPGGLRRFHAAPPVASQAIPTPTCSASSTP